MLTDHVSIWQLHVLRSILVVCFAFLAARLVSQLEMRPLISWRWAFARSAFFSSAFFMLYSGLPFLSLAQSGEYSSLGRCLSTLFAAVFLEERIGPRRIAALALGFSGVLVTAQPWTQGLTLRCCSRWAARFAMRWA